MNLLIGKEDRAYVKPVDAIGDAMFTNRTPCLLFIATATMVTHATTPHGNVTLKQPAPANSTLWQRLIGRVANSFTGTARDTKRAADFISKRAISR